MRKKADRTGQESSRRARQELGWVILAGATFLFFLLCRIPLFFLPAGENERLIVGFIVYFAIYLYSIVYGMFAWKVTGKVLLPALMLVGFVALISFSDFSGTLDKIQTITRPPGYGPALVMYLWKSLRFGALAAVIGGMIKNLKE